MNDLAGKHVLCVWEIGGELGHITRFANLTRVLEALGAQVSVAVKDLSRCHALFAGTGARLLQAPVWLPRVTLNRPIACLADTLLLQGYLEPDTLDALVQAWDSLFELTQPDLVIYDYAPTALLASRQRAFRKILVGIGFSDPVPGHPIADWRPYPCTDQLVAHQEQRVLGVINTVCDRRGDPPLTRLSDLFSVDATMINTFPELDLYRDLRPPGSHGHEADNRQQRDPVTFPPGSSARVVAYLKPRHPQLAPLLEALARCDASVFVAIPGGNPATLDPLVSSTFAYSTQLVALETAIGEADLFVGHGNIASTTQSLMAGTPVMILPIQLEQLLTGKRVQELGLGKLVEKIDSADQLRACLNDIVSNRRYTDQARDFADSHSLPSLTEEVTAHCMRLLTQG